jgi:hypothetical protein
MPHDRGQLTIDPVTTKVSPAIRRAIEEAAVVNKAQLSRLGN